MPSNRRGEAGRLEAQGSEGSARREQRLPKTKSISDLRGEPCARRGGKGEKDKEQRDCPQQNTGREAGWQHWEGARGERPENWG